MERSSFFNAELKGGQYDRVYLAEDYARYFASFIGNGVFPNPAANLQVIASDNMTITLKCGNAWINGYFYENTDILTLPITVADGVLNRIDRVVLRLDFLNRDIKAYIKKGTFASSPVAQGLQRDADMHEIGIADVLVSKGAIKITQANITDLRLNKEFCGIVHGTVEQVDPTAIFNQFQSWYTQTKNSYDTDFTNWTTEKKEAFDGWFTTNTKAFLDKFNIWYNTNTTQWTTNFTTWFDAIKGQLDGDVAAKLTAKTLELESNIKILNGVGVVKEKVNVTDFSTLVAKVEVNSAQLGDMDTKILDLKKHKTYKSNKDSNGIFTRIELKRLNDTILVVSILSGGISPRYTTRTETWYKEDGVAVESTKVYSMTYDADADVVSEV
ncbi:MAG: hypothetical protein RR486_09080 [Clostridium sp.]|uniref:hypothetical protein n=1 Tax=Clostridium sp. TaxID=1506 RepID=UPI00306A2C91